MITFLILIKLYRSGTNPTKLFQKHKLYYSVRHIFRNAKSFNHQQCLLAKYILEVPIDDKEPEIKSYLDVRAHFDEKWPFMKVITSEKAGHVHHNDLPVTMISSYSYLDFAHDPEVIEAGVVAARMYGTGNHGPRMLCGNLGIHEIFEKKLAAFFRKENALAFSSGYLACMSVITGVARKGDILLMDRLCHNSLVTGAKLTEAKIVKFKHNNFKEAEALLSKESYSGKLYIVIESVYSMDGDVGDLPAARKLADKYNGLIIMDEAHGVGAIGKTGRGGEEYYDWKYKADIICGSLTKSLGS
jgi:7-keto-8-aminopelargonate synthetase-like enzyme